MPQSDTPYKGLRFYEAEDSDIFAARKKDAVDCARLLAGRAAVIMLHGRTGCGKSSFLRAALSPLLKEIDTGLYFPQLPGGGFRVVRSGLMPLRAIARAVFDLVEALKQADPASSGDLDSVLGGFRERDAFVARHGEHFEVMLKMLIRLGDAVSGTPILVVDQAEEIYTLFDKSRRDDDQGAAQPSTRSTFSKADLLRARIEYMNLIRAVAVSPTGVKLLISLRTEYKGVFEDELRRDMSAEAGTRLTGFHLNDLDYDGLVEAIRKPETLKNPSGKKRFGFEYKDRVPEQIAVRLTAPNAVPMGGLLPTLQVICWRLYEQANRSKAKVANGATWTIQMTDLERLGQLDNQVEVYLRERLEEMLLELAAKAASSGGAAELIDIDRTREIDQWYRLLEKLVHVQGDGRAVTRQILEVDLVEEARRLQCKFADQAWAHLDEVGILRRDSTGSVPFWTLGHDSLGLAIQKWSVTYKDALDPGMRMDMNSPRQAARLTLASLFPAGEPPPCFEVGVPLDALWDHQLPSFAHLRNLSQRIGVRFVPDKNLVHPYERATRVLVAAERAAFPPPDGEAAWTDVAVSDLFQGNGLVGPPVTGIDPVRITNVINDRELQEKMQERLRRVLQHLSGINAKLLCYDKSAQSMLRLAAFLCDTPVAQVDALSYDDKFVPSAVRDELFEKLAAKKHDDRTFMVGTAFGRALASHRGYRTYFDCQDLTKLIDLQVKRARAEMGSQEVTDGIRKSFRLYRESAFHTVWQINIPSAEWRHIEHYPLIMRLAGMCYFTADYIRSFADDFVRHLYDWHARSFETESHVSRETIREMLRDCFVFLSFDENPRLLFDPDSRYEFNPRSSDGRRLRSTVRAIHVELTTLRRRTVDLFDQVCRQVEQLDGYVKTPMAMAQLSRAEELRACAWENFRIYNFYDSADQMDRALRIVGDVVAETMGTVWADPGRQHAHRPDAEGEAI